MAGNLTDYAEVQLHKWLLNLTPDYTPGVTKLALYTAPPGETGGGTEVTGGAYARQTITWGAPTSGTGAVTNSADVVFPTATASWGTITDGAIWDNAGTNMLWYGPLAASKTIGNGDVFKVLAGQLSLALD